MPCGNNNNKETPFNLRKITFFNGYPSFFDPDFAAGFSIIAGQGTVR
jgi:hypothetical protein